MRGISRIRALIGGLLVAATPGLADAGSATVFRDSWGVPHIWADSEAAAAFAHGYAQAEDRLDDLLLAYRIARGEAAAVLGEDWVERDLVARMAEHEKVARERYAELGPLTREVAEAFVAGVRHFMAENPDRVPDWAESPEPHDVVALYRAFIWIWPWGQALGDLRRRGSHVDDGRGSNAWVVSPKRSTGGAVIALIDPHLEWDAVSRFYEVHFHGGSLDFFGFAIIGTPLMALGHTDRFSLACTTGGPDCADVYEERIDPENPLLYAYENEWRPVQVEEVAIEVAAPNGTRIERRTIERTHHGPIVRRDGNRAWAVRTAYDREIGLIEQWLRMMQARNLGQFLEAMTVNQSLPQNIIYGDVHGHTYYVRAGRVPIRPSGYRWDRPVPGWTAATEWNGIHPLSELVQIVDPPVGFMQNCNISPGRMMPNSPLVAERYPPTIYNTRTDRNNTRGRRLLSILADRPRIDLDEALRIAVDVRVVDADSWTELLTRAFDELGRDFPDLADSVHLIREWDGQMATDSRAAGLFREWVRACRADGIDLLALGSDVGDGSVEQGRRLLEKLGVARRQMQERHGRIDPRWGEIQRARRGEHEWPVAGVRGDGIGTLRSVRGSAPDDRGISWVHGGQVGVVVVRLAEGEIASYSLSPFGQSNDPESPHYADQGRKLFGTSSLKPTWYRREDLEGNIESSYRLAYPPPAAADRAEAYVY